MMKEMVAVLLALFLMFGFVACGTESPLPTGASAEASTGDGAMETGVRIQAMEKIQIMVRSDIAVGDVTPYLFPYSEMIFNGGELVGVSTGRILGFNMVGSLEMMPHIAVASGFTVKLDGADYPCKVALYTLDGTLVCEDCESDDIGLASGKEYVAKFFVERHGTGKYSEEVQKVLGCVIVRVLPTAEVTLGGEMQ